MKSGQTPSAILNEKLKILKAFTGQDPRDLPLEFYDKLLEVFYVPIMDECIDPRLANEFALELLAMEIHDYLVKKQEWADLKESLSPYDFRKLKETYSTLTEPKKYRIRALLTILHNGHIPRKVERLINLI